MLFKIFFKYTYYYYDLKLMRIQEGRMLRLKKGGENSETYDACVTEVFRKRSDSLFTQKEI